MSDDAPALKSMGNPDQQRAAYAYNYLFQELVTDEYDLVGIVAYTIYKRAKVRWIQGFVVQHQREPTHSERDAFNESSKLHAEGYRSQAEGILSSFMQTALEEFAGRLEVEMREQFKEEMEHIDQRIAAGATAQFKSYEGHLKKIVEDAHGSWPKRVSEHVLAIVLSTILSGLLLLGLTAYNDGNLLEKVFKMLKKSEQHSKNDSTRVTDQ